MKLGLWPSSLGGWAIEVEMEGEGDLHLGGGATVIPVTGNAVNTELQGLVLKDARAA